MSSDSYQTVRIFFLDCPSHHPNPTSGGTCRVHTLVAVDHIWEAFFYLIPPLARTYCSTAVCPQRGAITVQREWCVCVNHYRDIRPAFNQSSPTSQSFLTQMLLLQAGVLSGWAAPIGRRARRLWRTTKLGLVRPWACSVGSHSAGCSLGVKVDSESCFTGDDLGRGEPLHKLCVSICTSLARLISMRWVIIWLYEVIFIEVVFFFLFCCVHILKCIYNPYQLWLSSILHKQSDKCLFSSLEPVLFGSFWAGPNIVVTVLYYHGVKMGTVSSCLRHTVWLSWPFALLHTYATIVRKEIGCVQFWHHQPTTQTKMWTFGTFATSCISHADNFKMIYRCFFPKRACSESSSGFPLLPFQPL